MRLLSLKCPPVWTASLPLALGTVIVEKKIISDQYPVEISTSSMSIKELTQCRWIWGTCFWVLVWEFLTMKFAEPHNYYNHCYQCDRSSITSNNCCRWFWHVSKFSNRKKHWTYKGKQKGSKTVSWSKLKYLKQTDSSHSSAWQKSFIWENPRTSKIFDTFYWKFHFKMACGLNSALLTTFLFEQFQVLFFFSADKCLSKADWLISSIYLGKQVFGKIQYC